MSILFLSYTACAVEEYARLDLKIKAPRMFFIKQQGIDYCDNYKLQSHNTVSNKAIIKVEGCENLTYF